MITNKTQGTTLCRTCELADSPLRKARGLMFRGSLPNGHGMLFHFPRGTRSAMWMFCMRFPIDMIFLDSKKRVIHIVENAPPLGLSWRTWRLYSPPSPATYILEIPSGKSRKTNTKVGDQLEL